MLKISDFSKYYGKKAAVEKLSLEIKPGEIFGFIGHNGAGKTTTIKAVCGILNFEKGEILIDNKDIKKQPIECKKLIAYIPDNPDIYEFMTGIKYLNFIADIYDIKTDERIALINEYAEMFELKSELNQPIGTYSHGMKQKLVIISALIRKPRLMVLDEPFVGLDPKAAHTLKELMRKLCKDGGAIFFSSHVLEVVEKLCDKVGIIKGGKLAAYGKTDDVRGDSSLEKIFLEMTTTMTGKEANNA